MRDLAAEKIHIEPLHAPHATAAHRSTRASLRPLVQLGGPAADLAASDVLQSLEPRPIVRRRAFPRRPDPQGTDANGPVELAPTILPALLDLDDVCVRKLGDDPFCGLTECGQLDGVRIFALLEPLGRQLYEPRAQFLGRA